MVCNSEDTISKIFTISLGPESYGVTKYRVGIGEKKYLVSADRTGIRFKNTKYESRIQQILCDSATYNYEKLSGIVDFILIDGSHTYEYVKNDTQKALEMVSENSVIVWHDYAKTSLDVPRFLSEVSKTMNLFHISGTSLVIKLPESHSFH